MSVTASDPAEGRPRRRRSRLGVRAALVHDAQTAELAAMHNDANILCLGGRLLEPGAARDLVDLWLDTSFEQRHQARLDKITNIELDRT